MVTLQQARRQARLSAVSVVHTLQTTVDRRWEPGVFSKMERGIVMPTPEAYQVLCQAYSVDKQAVFAPEDVDFGISPQKPIRRREGDDLEESPYKLTVRLPRALASDLRAKVKARGYGSIQEYVLYCISLLDKEKAVPAGTGTAKATKKVAPNG